MAPLLLKYQQSSGLLLLVAGSFIVFGALFKPDETLVGAYLNDACGCVYTTYGLGFLLSILGLVALYLVAGHLLGQIARVALLTSALLAGFISGTTILLKGFILPILEANSLYAPLVGSTGVVSAGMPMVLVDGVFLLYSVAISIVGVRLMRNKEWRLPGVFLLAAILIALTPPFPYLIGMLGGVFLGLGHIFLGYRLWKHRGEEQPSVIV